MFNYLRVALVLGLASVASPALALQTVVTAIDKNADGTMTYHFAIKVEPGEQLAPGNKATADFFTIYNFYGLVEGSTKSPAGWQFSSEEFGRTPVMNGYPMVLPVDVPNTPNLTWTVTKAVTAPAQIEGFSATTHMPTSVEGEYSAQQTLQQPGVQGVSATATKETKQAIIGTIPTPSFLAAATN